jgi:hypothetical protein
LWAVSAQAGRQLLSGAAELPAAAPAAIGFGPAHAVGDAYETMQALVAGDLDRDERPDLATASGQKIQVWKNPASPFGSAWASNMTGSAGGVVGALAVGDLDKDGYPDLVAGLGSAASVELLLLRNDGTPFSGLWPTSNAAALAGSIHALALADLDRDGWLDIISDDGLGQLLIWKNDGTPFSGGWTPTPFAYRIEWKAGTRRIELRDAQENVLASREVSAHAPVVGVVDPKGGEVLVQGEPLTVHWSAADQDGDPLIYSVAISADGGQSWLLVESDLTDTQATIDTGTLWPGDTTGCGCAPRMG